MLTGFPARQAANEYVYTLKTVLNKGEEEAARGNLPFGESEEKCLSIIHQSF